SAFEGWVIDQLCFVRAAGNLPSTLRRYEPLFRPQLGHRDYFEYCTQVPLGWVMAHLAGENQPIPGDGRYHRRQVHELLTRYHDGCPMGVFDRERAVGLRGVELHRLGAPFVEAMHEFIQWDDRGRVFAAWRPLNDWDGPPLVAFRF